MMPASTVVGLGGVFFASPDPGRLYDWYAKHLGLNRKPGEAVLLPWRGLAPNSPPRMTVLSVFPENSPFPGGQPVMLNFIVDDLDAALAALSDQGVRIDPYRESDENGRFAMIYDPDGSRIALWEPIRK